jgi:hypothetical protein
MLNTCDAINQCDAPFPYEKGKVCGDHAEYQHGNHAVCWTHKQRLEAGKDVTFEGSVCANAAE